MLSFQGWSWWFDQHFMLRVCTLPLRRHFEELISGTFTFFKDCLQTLSWLLVDMSPQPDGSVVAFESAWDLDIGKSMWPPVPINR